MTSSFTRNLKPCSGNGIFVYPEPGANPDCAFLPPAAHASASPPGHVFLHLAEGAFLKRLLADEGSAESLRLHERLTKADYHGKCILRTVLFFGSLFVLSFVVLSYCAVLLPVLFDHPQFVIRGLIFLCLVALISEVELLGYLLWHRMVVNRLHQQCRLMLSLIGSQLKAS